MSSVCGTTNYLLIDVDIIPKFTRHVNFPHDFQKNILKFFLWYIAALEYELSLPADSAQSGLDKSGS